MGFSGFRTAAEHNGTTLSTNCVPQILLRKYKKKLFYRYLLQLVVGSREMLKLPQPSQVPDVVSVSATDVQDTKGILHKEFQNVKS